MQSDISYEEKPFEDVFVYIIFDLMPKFIGGEREFKIYIQMKLLIIFSFASNKVVT